MAALQNYQKRIILDIKDIMKDPIENIHYAPLETNINVGYIMIVGPKGTPYQHGFYNFKIEFPRDYPYSPPHCTYLTNDGITRFNPNFYKGGKVCLSILNTWPGEKWSSCQTLRSILITLQMTMNEEPLRNEPGINDQHKQSIEVYNKIIEYRNIEHSILRQLNFNNEEVKPLYLKFFIEEMKDYFLKNKNEVLETIENNIDVNDNLATSFYGMSCNRNYKQLKQCFMDISKYLET